MSHSTPGNPRDDQIDPEDDFVVEGFEDDVPIDPDPEAIDVSQDLGSPTAQDVDAALLATQDEEADKPALPKQSRLDGDELLDDRSISGSRERVGQRKWYVLVGLAVLTFALVYGIAGSRDADPVRVPVRTGETQSQQVITATGLSHTDRSLQFISETLRQMTDEISALTESTELLKERQDTVEERFTTRMEQGLAESAQVVQDTLDTLQQASIQRENEAQSQELLFEWRRNLASDQDAALKKIESFRDSLGRLDIPSEQIDQYIAEALEEHGIIVLKDLAEPLLRETDTAQVAAHIAPYILAMRDTLYTHAYSSGEVLRSDALEAIASRTYQRLAGRALDVNDIDDIWPFIRVRRENLMDRHKSAMPALFDKMVTAVPDRNPYRVQAFVWEERSLLRPLSPGQQLSIIQVLTRRIGNVPGLGEAKRRPFSEQAQGFADDVVLEAVKSARSRGITQLTQLRQPADKALREYIDMARIEISSVDYAEFLESSIQRALRTQTVARSDDPLKWRIQQLLAEGKGTQNERDVGNSTIAQLLARMASSYLGERGRIIDNNGAVHALSGPDGTVYDMDGATIGRLDADLFTALNGEEVKLNGSVAPESQPTEPARTITTVTQDTGLPMRIGTIEASLADTMVAGYVLSALLADTIGLEDPSDTSYAAALTAAWSQVDTLTPAPFQEFSGSFDGGSKWGEIMAPQLIEILQAGRGFRRFELIPAIKPSEPYFGVMRGIILGNTYGPIIREPALAQQATESAMAEWSKWTPPDNILAVFRQYPSSIKQILAIQKSMGYRHLSLEPEALATLIKVARDTNNRAIDIIASLPDPSAWGSDTQGFQTVAQSSMMAFSPLAVASYSSLWNEPQQLAKLVEVEMLRYIAGIVAIDKIYVEVNNSMLPRYAASLPDRNVGMSRLAQLITSVTPQYVYQLLGQVPEVEAGRVMITADAVAKEVIGQIERAIVIDVIMSRAEPRIRRIGELGGSDAITSLTDAARDHARNIISPKFTPARIDGWVREVVAFAQQLHNGETQQVPVGPGTAGGVAPIVFPEPRAIGKTGDKTFGDPRITVTAIAGADGEGNIRRITIPAGSYGNAHILNGVNAEIGGADGEGVLLNFTYSWKGPNNSRLLMRNLRLMASATPSPGTERVKLNLENLSYVFESGHSIFQSVSGYVVDDQDSLAGVPGTLDLNIDRVLPWAVAAGGTKGFGEAVESIVEGEIEAEQLAAQAAIAGGNGGTAPGSTSTQDIVKRASLIGGAEGIGNISGYMDRVVADIRPSIRVPNGRSVTVVLSQPVVFDVPESEFRSLLIMPGGL